MADEKRVTLEKLARRAREIGIIDHYVIDRDGVILHVEGQQLPLDPDEAMAFLETALRAIDLNPPPVRLHQRYPRPGQ